MDSRRGSQPHHARVRRLGKKAIFYGRIATALGVALPEPIKKQSYFGRVTQRVKSFRPTRKQWTFAACTAVLAIAGSVGYSFYHASQVAAAKAAAKAAYDKQVKIEAAAQVCYKQKTVEKQKMLGKVTFDQLYDGDSCTTAQ